MTITVTVEADWDEDKTKTALVQLVRDCLTDESCTIVIKWDGARRLGSIAAGDPVEE